MSRNRLARFGLLPLAAGAALLTAAGGPASAAGLLPKPGSLLKPEIYRPDGGKPCLHAVPLCLPDRSQFTPFPEHTA